MFSYSWPCGAVLGLFAIVSAAYAQVPVGPIGSASGIGPFLPLTGGTLSSALTIDPAAGAPALIVTSKTGNTNPFTLMQEQDVTSFPVPTFYPINPNSTIALDIVPNGTPSEFGQNGVAWEDVCNVDIVASPSANVQCVRMAAGTSGGINAVRIGTAGFGEAALPLQIGSLASGSWTTALTFTSGSSTTTFNGQMVNANLTTGTNADTVCLKADGTFLIQAAACTISSLRFKNVLSGYDDYSALGVVRRLEPIVFTMKPGGSPNADWNYDKPQIGLSAENVAKVDRRCAVYEQDGKTPKSYRQECLIAVLVGAVKEQQREIDTLKRQIAHRS